MFVYLDKYLNIFSNPQEIFAQIHDILSVFPKKKGLPGVIKNWHFGKNSYREN